ncbi:DUF397 domain-containing protein [Actinomadura sp. 6N118]|uniref:DUF397 domain-containing protein n=1 Tax=Actinomadura sp. 6N118 TaxID=3375151 RepID=UPI003792A6F0
MDLSDAKWRKSSQSTSQGGECVELAAVPGVVAVRDSKDPEGPMLVFTVKAFRRFAEGVRHRA